MTGGVIAGLCPTSLVCPVVPAWISTLTDGWGSIPLTGATFTEDYQIMSKAIYKFHLDCGRMGDLDGVFIAEESEVASRMGCVIDYGEALGKHSEIADVLTEQQLTCVSVDEGEVALLERLGLSSFGTNPLCYQYKKDGVWIDV